MDKVTDAPELRELLKSATALPWKASPYRGSIDSQVWAGEPGPDATLICAEGDASDADAALIVAAVNSLPDLLDRLEAQAKRIAELEEGLRPFASVAAALDFYIPEAMPFTEDGAIYFPRGDVRISDGPGHIGITEAHFRRARAALNPETPNG